MKFTKGFWLNRANYDLSKPVEVVDYIFDGKSLILHVAHKQITSRADMLNRPVSVFTITSPRKNIIRVVNEHFQGNYQKEPVFELYCENQEDNPLDFTEEKETVTLLTGDTKAVICLSDFYISYTYKDRFLTRTFEKGQAYIKDLYAKDTPVFTREQLGLSVHEKVYGLGERFTEFVKNGQTVDMWNEDGGTCSEIAYKNIPFYITNRGYGVFVNHPELVSYEVASEVVSRVQFSVEGEKLDYMIVGGRDMKDVLDGYTALTGRPGRPPEWSYGLWLTTSFTTDYDEATINRFVDGMIERDIALDVFHFDCFWMKGFHWCDFQWDKSCFPDPIGLIKRLKAKGLKICVWINPYISGLSPLFKEGMEKGYLLKKQDGNVWQTDLWQPGMGIVDFTNPMANDWYASKLQVLIDMGVDSFKTDFGERIPTEVVYYNGADPIKMHNYYTFLYNQCVFELLEKNYGKGEAALFARSATVGGQQFPVHWGGDCSSNYESMAETLRGGLSLALSGFAFWSHDISGFEQAGTPDLYKRWVAFGLLSSHSRLHGSTSYRVPWLFDEEAVDVLRYFVNLKKSLMPYILKAADMAVTKGIPVMRPMVLEYPEDNSCLSIDTQYMIGSDLLVAPIFNDSGKATYYLPKGKWCHLMDKRVLEGGRWYEETYDYFSLPVFLNADTLDVTLKELIS